MFLAVARYQLATMAQQLSSSRVMISVGPFACSRKPPTPHPMEGSGLTTRPEDQWAKSTRSEGGVGSRRRGEGEFVLQRSLERSTKRGPVSRALLPPLSLARSLTGARARGRSSRSCRPRRRLMGFMVGVTLAGVATTRGGVCFHRNYDDALVKGHGSMFHLASHSNVDHTGAHEDVPIVWRGSTLSEQALCRRLGIS